MCVRGQNGRNELESERQDHNHRDGGGQHKTAWSCKLPSLRMHDGASPRLQSRRRNPHIETRCFVALEKGQEATIAGRQPSERLRMDVPAGCFQRALFVLLQVGHKAMEKPSLLPSPRSQRPRIATSPQTTRQDAQLLGSKERGDDERNA